MEGGKEGDKEGTKGTLGWGQRWHKRGMMMRGTTGSLGGGKRGGQGGDVRDMEGM